MDISSYISELLFEHDCVIIPNFGGFICNYKAADIHPVLNTISPPSKAISFNRNLQSNDGLLVNHIANTHSISFDAAYELVTGWVNSSKNLLHKKEELQLKKVGKFSNDFEGNLQFAPLEDVNYLKTSFGLRTITALPIIRAKQIDFTEKFKKETKHIIPANPKRVWSIAASVLLIVTLVALAELMWIGIEVKPLHLDEAGVFGCITRMFKAPVPEITPVPVEVKTTTATKADIPVAVQPVIIDSSSVNTIQPDNEKNVVEEINISTASGHTYYVIIGAFAEEKNVEAAKQRLQQKFPYSIILVEKQNRLTKLGYSVGGNFFRAKEQLATAQSEDSSFWLLKK